ncbi:MAG: hypothetical protein Ta2F_00360 [Termitinemataceae bacterium]|nr:MAG: hypothetical protein Ta2F_00360 [Termitinemataceae bacterium]
MQKITEFIEKATSGESFKTNKYNLELLFSNIDDTTQTMYSIINYIRSEQGNFGNIKTWSDFNN